MCQCYCNLFLKILAYRCCVTASMVRMLVALSAVVPVGCQTNGARPLGATFSVMTYNVCVDRPDMDTVEHIIRESKADIVFLQEVTTDWAPTLSSLRGQYPHQRFTGDVQQVNNALLSRFPLANTSRMSTRCGWHAAWFAVAKTPIGDVQLLGVHLAPPLTRDRRLTVSSLLQNGPIHEQEITQYCIDIDFNSPLIVLGDFNENDGGAAASWLRKRGLQSALGNHDILSPTWVWPQMPLLTGRLDHIFYSSHLHAWDARVAWGGSSDHRPVIAAFCVGDDLDRQLAWAKPEGGS